ncbi:MAG: AAA family ATPase, partial [Mycobacteriales bacterium]
MAVLVGAAGIEAASPTRLFADVDRVDARSGGRAAGLAKSSVLVVDKASLVETRVLAALIERAGTAGAKLVLVGDPRQLPEIDAGDVLAAVDAFASHGRVHTEASTQAARERIVADYLVACAGGAVDAVMLPAAA